ncbi:MAG: AI-2E family transporter [Clostridia bacterium]|nr:AI-2E family transporter [Clostridia bacterium]
MKKFSFKTGLILAFCGFLLYLGIHYWPSVSALCTGLFSAALPLIIGFLIAYIVNIVMSAYERWIFGKAKKKWIRVMKRPISMTLAYLSFFAVVALVIGLIIPQLVDCIRMLVGMLPSAIDKAIDFFDKHHLLSKEVLDALNAIDWKSRVEQLVDMVTSGVSDVVSIVIQTLQGVVSGVITAFLSFIFSIYLLSGKERLKAQADRLCHHFLPESLHQKVLYVVYNFNLAFRKYLIGQCTEAVILGILCGIGMMILRLPYAAMISTLIAFTALSPIAGAYIGALVGAFMILTESPVKALIFLVFLVILQQLEGNLIYPRVVGSSLGLPGIWVLAAVTVGGGIAGIPGMFLGVPLVAAFYRMVRDTLSAKEAAEAASKESEETV